MSRLRQRRTFSGAGRPEIAESVATSASTSARPVIEVKPWAGMPNRSRSASAAFASESPT